MRLSVKGSLDEGVFRFQEPFTLLLQQFLDKLIDDQSANIVIIDLQFFQLEYQRLFLIP